MESPLPAIIFLDVNTPNGAFWGRNGRDMVIQVFFRLVFFTFFLVTKRPLRMFWRGGGRGSFLFWINKSGRARPQAPFRLALSSSMLVAGYQTVIWRLNPKLTFLPLLSIDWSLPGLDHYPASPSWHFVGLSPCLSCWGWGSQSAWCSSRTSYFRQSICQRVLSFGASHEGCSSFLAVEE